MADRCDVLVIGGGAAGCVVAARLAEDRRRKVTLLEAGPRDRHPALRIPGAMAYVLAARRLNWSDATEPEPALEGRQLYLSQARVLGGGTSINGLVYARGQPGDYDDWRDADCPGWGFSDVLPYFRRSEASARGPSELHGDAGPMRTRVAESPLPIATAFLAATSEAGFPRLDDLNGWDQEGFGLYDWTVAGGRRVSSASAWLRNAPANLTIRTGVRVLRLIVEDGRARGCEFLLGDALDLALADQVVLSAGALRTPQLLMLSGIGPAEHLRPLGIRVKLDLPGVGANLRNHVSYKLQYATNAPVTAYRYLNPLRATGSLALYLLARRGYLALAPTPVGGFFRSNPTLDRPDIQAFMSPALSGRAGEGLARLMPRRHGFSIFMNQGRPNSTGTLRLASANPLAAPRIQPNYFSDPGDLACLLDAAERLRGLAETKPLRHLISAELAPGTTVAGRTALEADIRRNATNHFHVAGTCRMGSDAGAVVDPRLRLRGLEGLTIADASVMPRLVNGNTAAPVVMIAERAAEFLAEGS